MLRKELLLILPLVVAVTVSQTNRGYDYYGTSNVRDQRPQPIYGNRQLVLPERPVPRPGPVIAAPAPAAAEAPAATAPAEAPAATAPAVPTSAASDPAAPAPAVSAPAAPPAPLAPPPPPLYLPRYIRPVLTPRPIRPIVAPQPPVTEGAIQPEVEQPQPVPIPAETIRPENVVVEPLPAPAPQPEPVPLPKPVPPPKPILLPEPKPIIEPEREPIIEPEPKPIIEPEREPIIKPEPKPIIEPEPKPIIEPEPEPIIKPEPKPIIEPEPMPEPKPIVEPEPMPQPKPIVEPEPLPQPEPILQPEPAPQPKPVVLPAPVLQPKPVVQPEPLVKPKPVPQPEPIPKPESTPLPEFIPVPVELTPKPEPIPQPKPTPEPTILKERDSPVHKPVDSTRVVESLRYVNIPHSNKPAPLPPLLPKPEPVREPAFGRHPQPTPDVHYYTVPDRTPFGDTTPTPPHTHTQPAPVEFPVQPRHSTVDYGPQELDFDFHCTAPYAYYPIEHECDTFIGCKQNTPYKYTCPDGLHFNPAAKSNEFPCAYPSEVKCMAGAEEQNPRPTDRCPNQYGYYSIADGDCSKFIMCQEGAATVMDCPMGLVFNPQTSTCDWPANVPQCNPDVFKGFACPEPPKDEYGQVSDIIYKYRYGQQCKLYIACQLGRPRLLSCDRGLSFDEASQSCLDEDYVTDCAAPYLRDLQ